MATVSPSAPYKQIDAHPEAIRFPLMEWPLIGFLLAFICGTLNAWTLMNAGTFATVQSGNVASSGIYLAAGDWTRLGFAWGSVLAFGLGSMICGFFMTSLLKRGREFTVPVLVIEAVVTALVGIMWALGVFGESVNGAHLVCFAVSFVAGAQGNSFHKDHGMLYGNVAVTFVVQAAFNFLGQSFVHPKGINGEPNSRWAGIFFSVLLGFAGGGAIGALLVMGLGWDSSNKNGTPVLETGWALLLPAAIMAVLAIVAAGKAKKSNPDPTPGGLIA